jgi:hypothetical protein
VSDVPAGNIVNMILTSDLGEVATCSYIAGEVDHCQLGTLATGRWTLTATVHNAAGEPLPGVQAVEIFVEGTNTAVEAPSSTGETLPTAPLDNSATVALLASLLALVALQARQKSNVQRLDSDERAESGVASFAAGSGSGGLDQRRDVYCPPCFTPLDLWVRRTAFRSSYASPALGRILDDGSYLRALVGVFWPFALMAGVVLGASAAVSTDGIVALPSLWIVVALVVVGSLDALVGLSAALSYAVVIVTRGGFDTADAVRGYLGLAALMILVGLVASKMRPYRRESFGDFVWNRSVDFVLIPLLGAWAAGSIYRTIPHLSGYSAPWADRVGVIELSALVALVVRFGLENAARLMVSNRLRLIENEWLPEATETQKTLSRILRTGVFVFVAVVFVGANWWLVAGAAMYLLPKIVKPIAKSLPNSKLLYQLVPRNLVRVVAMLLVMHWWGSVIIDSVESNQVQWAFVLMSIPGLVLNIVDSFARVGRTRQSTALSRIAGIGVLVIGVSIVRGFIL